MDSFLIDIVRISFYFNKIGEHMQQLKNAPVSELVFGLTLKEKIPDSEIIQIVNYFLEAYPLFEIAPPIANEWMNGFQVVPEFDISTSGQVLYRLRSSDRRFLVQLQNNKIFFNWIRDDLEPVGNYPGFSKLYGIFSSVLRNAEEISGMAFRDITKYYEVTYHDRLFWQEIIGTISNIDQIMNVNLPSIPLIEGLNNIFSNFTYHNPRIGGYGSIAINTSTAIDGKQLLRFESMIRGYVNEISMDEWFKLGHDFQNGIFESSFKQSILERWR